MTRTLGCLVAIGLAGCQESTPELPAAIELGAGVRIVEVVGDVAYWVEGSQVGPGVRLRRYRAGVTETVDELPEIHDVPDLGWPSIAASDTAVVWGFGTPLLGGCFGRSVQLGDAGEDLGLFEAECPMLPIVLRDRALTFFNTPDVDTAAIARADLSTGAVEELARLSGTPIGIPVVHGDRMYTLLTRGTADAPFTVVTTFDLRAPDAPMEVASAPIAGQRLRHDVFTVGDGWLAWLDDRSTTDEGWRVVVRTDAGDAVTELPQAVHSLAAAGGALWMITDDAEGLEPARLLRVPDGTAPASSPTSLTIGADIGAHTLTGFGEALLVETTDFRLLLQPLP